MVVNLILAFFWLMMMHALLNASCFAALCGPDEARVIEYEKKAVTNDGHDHSVRPNVDIGEVNRAMDTNYDSFDSDSEFGSTTNDAINLGSVNNKHGNCGLHIIKTCA